VDGVRATRKRETTFYAAAVATTSTTLRSSKRARKRDHDAGDVANHFVFVYEVADGQIASMDEYATWTAKEPHSGWGEVPATRRRWWWW
jgi:ketosteroid isomerase-like protein